MPVLPQVRFVDLDAVRVDDAVLSAAERARVDRKATARLRQRQAASFFFVRQCLGTALGLPAADVPINVQAGGKPFIEGRAVAFNLSHCHGMGMVAWGETELGVDIEALMTRPRDALAAKVLCAREAAAWAQVPEHGRAAWLTRAWTRKEALVKATGEGLRLPPRTVDVGGGDGEGGAWSAWVGDRLWQGQDWTDGVPDGHRAAICMAIDHG